MKQFLLALLVLFLFAGTAAASVDTLAVDTLTYAGMTPSFENASDTVYVPNNGYTFIEVKNASGAEITVTIASQKSASEGLSVSNLAVTVAATTGDKIIGPLSQSAWNNSSGLVRLIFSAKTSVTVDARKMLR